jgi:hypothetical protein
VVPSWGVWVECHMALARVAGARAVEVLATDVFMYCRFWPP